MGYSMLMRTIRQLSWTALETPNGRSANFSIDVAILKMLNGDLTASVREVAQEPKLFASAVFYVLTTHMGYIYRRCRLIPHHLSEPQKIDRLRQSHELLEILQKTKRLRWRFILTADESWLFCMNKHWKLWLLLDSDVPEVARRLTNTPKVMITLFWNPAGLHVTDFLASGLDNGDYFVTNVLTPIHLLPIVAAVHK
jgi:hypothetical protein